MAKKQKQPQKPRSTNLLAGFFLFVMFTVFPLFCSDGYFHIRHDRYYFFLGAAAVLVLGSGLLWLSARDKTPGIGKLSVTHWSLVAFLAVCLVSTLCSANPGDALWGTAGRNNGLLLMAAYAAVYFVISRCDGMSKPVYLGFLVTFSIVSLLAVLNFFYLDPLNMVSRLQVSEQRIFISTIGNKNLLSSYLCIGLPMATVLFVTQEDKVLQWGSFAAAILGFGALMTADSDSGILGFGVLVATLLIWTATDTGRLKRLCGILSAMLFSGRLMALLSPEVGFLQRLVVALPGATVLLVAMLLLKPGKSLPWLRWVFVGLFGALAVAFLGAMVLFTAIRPETPLEGLWSLLRLDYTWGTNRGFMWIKSLEIFRNCSWKDKLLGTGPDTFYYAFRPYFEEMATFGNSSTNAAHNEYLNYLITVGLLGLGAYLTAVGSALVQGIRRVRSQPATMVFVAAVICYSAQALVNIAQPITTPLFLLTLALCGQMGGTRNKI